MADKEGEGRGEKADKEGGERGEEADI